MCCVARAWSCVLCILFVLLGQASAQTARKTEKRTEFGTGVETGFGMAQYHDTCVIFRVFFIAGKFFVGLHQVGARSGSEFEKDRVKYRVFPNPFIVDVEATAFPCSPSTKPVPPDFASGLVGELSFQPHWRKGQLERSVNVVSTRVRHPNMGIRWDYFLEISDDHTCLSQELLLDVEMREASNHVRLSAQLK